MVMDFNRLTTLLREHVIAAVDHKHLNLDVPFLAGIIPTAENVAVAFWKRIEPRVREFEGCELRRIRVYESRNNFVDYEGETA